MSKDTVCTCNGYSFKTLFGIFVLCLIFIWQTNSYAQNSKQINYPNGALKEEGTVNAEGKKIGIWKSFYPNGKPMAEQNFINDTLEGWFISYYLSGKLQHREFYQKGLLTDSSYYYYESGGLYRKGIYVRGLYRREWLYFYETGELERRRVFASNYSLPDTLYAYYQNGVLAYKGLLLDGNEEGFYRFFDEQNAVMSEGNYRAGKKVGEWLERNKRGELVRKRYKK